MGANNSIYSTRNKESLKNPQISWWLSWPVIIAVTIGFWPVGIFLIWRRTVIDKQAAMISGTIIAIIGWISIVFAGLAFVVTLVEGIDSDAVIVIIFFTIAGVALILLARKIKKSAEKFRKYISIIVNRGETSISNIAAAIPTSYEIVQKDLQKMIDRGYFTGAYINEMSKEIILPEKQEGSNIIDKSIQANPNSTPETVVVKCNGCGANNKIVKGSVNECQYCGSPISS